MSASPQKPPTSSYYYADCHINSLPCELLNIIFQHLSVQDLLHCSQVNAKWFQIVRETLLRTTSHCLVKDAASCEDFNSEEKQIRGLILTDVDVWKRFRVEKLAGLMSFHFASEGNFNLENLKGILSYCSSLIEVTLKTNTPLVLSYIEELLCELKELRRICLLIGEVTLEQRKNLVDFFSTCHYFYDEIVIQNLSDGVSNELLYVCSNKTKLNPHVFSDYSKVHFGHVNTALVENVLSTSSTKIKELEMIGDRSNDMLKALCNRDIERLSLQYMSCENEAWKRFFNDVKDSTVLKVLNISHCKNITHEEIQQLENLHLNSLDIDFSSCPKIYLKEQFLNYCLSHISKLKICFEYDPDILEIFTSLLKKFSTTAVAKEIGLEILRVNHCSENISYHLEKFKLGLQKVSSQGSVHVNVEEIFTFVSQNIP